VKIYSIVQSQTRNIKQLHYNCINDIHVFQLGMILPKPIKKVMASDYKSVAVINLYFIWGNYTGG